MLAAGHEETRRKLVPSVVEALLFAADWIDYVKGGAHCRTTE